MSRVPAICCSVLLTATALAAEEPASLRQALEEGDLRLALRYRYENVDDEAVGPLEGRASTLRTTLAYESAPFRGFAFLIEAENVAVVGNDLYNNRGAGRLANGVTDRPVVADPALTEINQAFVRYAWESGRLQLGRQEILRGDQRFVGNVGWRQNHQSYDALTFAHDVGDRVEFHYAFVDRVHRIFGDSLETRSHLLDVAVAAGRAGTVTAYAYLLDYERPENARLASSTVGAELAGQRQLADGRKLLWELEHARQRDAGDNPARIDAGYLHAMLGGAARGLTLKLGWEMLEGGDGGLPFSTPLATLHKFNGWADKFLATPTDGLEDLYLSLGGKLEAFDWNVILHDFRAESGGSAYGRELDLQLLYRTPWKQAVALTIALYDADGFAADTDKWMLWTTFSI